MFEGGLLASFIPEILMVIGFVLCLLTPAFKATNSSVEQVPIVAHISNFERQQTASYVLTVSDFYSDEQITETKYSLTHFIEILIFNRFKFHFSTSKGLCFVDFSRPPPTFLS